jgi:hypothetical protein
MTVSGAGLGYDDLAAGGRIGRSIAMWVSDNNVMIYIEDVKGIWRFAWKWDVNH